MQVKKSSFVAALAAVSLACGGGGTGDPAGPPPPPPPGPPVSTATVGVYNDYFFPNSVNLTVGGSVTWNWVGSGHSVTSAGNPGFSPGATISNAPRTLGPVIFATAGTYSYYCTEHGASSGPYAGTMVGTIIVQ
ncbi:MAG: hypothetical protein HOP28_13100 [Gemmatimonadales bacterium]|nr:hypothetical protein [Gemmatimonadales bacterium]